MNFKEAPGDQDGFTLLEMIVALTILALVLGLASQTVVMASRSISVGNSRYKDAVGIRTALAHLESSDEKDDETSSGWLIKKRSLDIGGQKLLALIIERKDGGPTDSVLTFYPERPADLP